MGTGAANTSGTANAFFGTGTGIANTTGGSNSFFGYQSGYSNTTGSNNTFSGTQAGYFNTTGFRNTFNGYQAGHLNSTGTNNTFSGYQAGFSNTTGSTNTFIGVESGLSNTTGTNNTFSGTSAGYTNTIGSNNTLTGVEANVGANNLTNASAFGFRAQANCSNCLVLGSVDGANGATVTAKVGIGTTAPTERLEVNGNIKLSSGSTVKFADGTMIGGAITASELANNAVTTAKILDANVTTAKLADGAVTSAKLAVPLLLNGAVAANGIVTATNTDTTGRGLAGISSSATGVNAGVYGESASASGFGVHAKNTAVNGFAGNFEGHVSLTGAINNAWRTQANATSPNIIAGEQGNILHAGVSGGVIAGGGKSAFNNCVSDDFGVVGGGINNQAGDNAGTTTDKPYATVAGGAFNFATGELSTVGGGNLNFARGRSSTISGGSQARATHYGEWAYASGSFEASQSETSAGLAQASLYVARGVTNGFSNTVELVLSTNNDRLTIAAGRTVTFEILVVGRQDVTGISASYRFKGGIKNVGGTTSLVGTVVKEVLGEDDANWDVNVTADDALDILKIEVTGVVPGNGIRWVASVRTVEVQW